MIVFALFVLVLADYKFVPQPVEANQFYQMTANNVGRKHKRSAEEKGCQLPSPLKNGLYTPSSRRCSPQDASPSCRMVPGTRVPEFWPIFYECDPGYILNTTVAGTVERRPSICRNGQWSPTLLACVASHYNSKILAQSQSSSGNCGKPANPLGRKIEDDGTVSKKGAWPWMVIFGVRNSSSQKSDIHWFCAGSLVTSRHILTAAHCIADYRNRNSFFARFNDINLDDASDDKGVIEVEIKNNDIFIHPGFKKEQVYSHNLAIIKLNADFPDFLRPICLPTPDFKQKSFDDETVFLTSWGQTDNDREWSRKRNYHPILHDLQATVVNQADCSHNYGTHQSDDFIIVGWDLICASVSTNKSCQGDAGSPLMLKIKDTYVLIGVVATPFRCYDELFPRLFTRLSIYMDWIIANLNV